MRRVGKSFLYDTSKLYNKLLKMEAVGFVFSEVRERSAGTLDSFSTNSYVLQAASLLSLACFGHAQLKPLH